MSLCGLGLELFEVLDWNDHLEEAEKHSFLLNLHGLLEC